MLPGAPPDPVGPVGPVGPVIDRPGAPGVPAGPVGPGVSPDICAAVTRTDVPAWTASSSSDPLIKTAAGKLEI